MKIILYYLLVYFQINKFNFKLVSESSCSLQQIYHTNKNNYSNKDNQLNNFTNTNTNTIATTNKLASKSHMSSLISKLYNKSSPKIELINEINKTNENTNTISNRAKTISSTNSFVIYKASLGNSHWTISVIEKPDLYNYKVKGQEYYHDFTTGEIWYLHDKYDGKFKSAFKKCFSLNKEIKATNKLNNVIYFSRKLTMQPTKYLENLSQVSSSFLQRQVEYKFDDDDHFTNPNSNTNSSNTNLNPNNNIVQTQTKKQNIKTLLLDYITLKKERENKYNDYVSKIKNIKKLISSKNELNKKILKNIMTNYIKSINTKIKNLKSNIKVTKKNKVNFLAKTDKASSKIKTINVNDNNDTEPMDLNEDFEIPSNELADDDKYFNNRVDKDNRDEYSSIDEADQEEYEKELENDLNPNGYSSNDSFDDNDKNNDDELN